MLRKFIALHSTLTLSLGLCIHAFASQPPDSVKSDSADNTAFGSGALNVTTADENSAFGMDALYSNTLGGDNLAAASASKRGMIS